MNVQDFLKGFHPSASGDYVLDATTLGLAGATRMGTLYLDGTTWTVTSATCDPVALTVTGLMALTGSPQPLTLCLAFQATDNAISGVIVRLSTATLNLQTSYVHWDMAQAAPSLPMKSANMGFVADATTVTSRMGFSVAMTRTPKPLLLDLWANAATPQGVLAGSMIVLTADLGSWSGGLPLGTIDALQDLAPNARFDEFPSIIPLKTNLMTGLQFMAWIQQPSGMPVLETMTATVQIASAFTVVEGFFDLDTLNATMLMPDLAGSMVYYTLGGEFDLGHLLGTRGVNPEKFGMTLLWEPDEQARRRALGEPAGEVPVVFSASILTPIDLAAVLKKCLGLSDLGPLKTLNIDSLTVQGDVASNGVLQLDILLSGTLSLCGKLPLESLELCLRRDVDGSWGCLISTTFDLGGYRMYLAGIYDQGWSFIGALSQQRKALPTLSAFFQSLGSIFGITVPDDVGSMSSLVSIDFSAVLGDESSVAFTFQGQTGFCDQTVGLIVTANLSHQNGTMHQDFSGTLFVEDPTGQGGAQIQVIYDDHTFLGAWTNRHPNPYQMSDILKWFGLGALDDLPLLLPDDLTVQHTPVGVGVTLGLGAIQGGLARFTPASGQPAAWVAALQIDLGLTFSRTPLASSGMPPAQDFGLPSTALMYASAACATLTPAQVATLFLLMPAPPQGGMLPPGAPGMGLTAGLALDPTVQPANLLANPMSLPQGSRPSTGRRHRPAPPSSRPENLNDLVGPVPAVSAVSAITPATWEIVTDAPRPRAGEARSSPSGGPLAAASGGLFAWVPVNKALGPVIIGRLGIGYQAGANGPQVALGIDAGFSIDGFTLEFLGLTLAHDFKADADLTIGLQGLSVGYDDGAIEVQGQFLQVQGQAGTEYIGDVSLTMLDLAVAVDGAYGKVKTPDGGEAASLFIFGLMGEPMGGAPWCFITGLAAGAGINRALQMPALQDLPQFPLVAAAIDPAGPTNPFSPGTTPDTALTVMENVLPPAYGNKWFALGVRFSSFGLLESFALMTASFGASTQIGLMGVSALTLPRGAPDPIAYAELALEAMLDPSAGTLTVNGQLTPQSYVISPACQLQGGFGFAAWFKDQTVTLNGVPWTIAAGDFALSLGGYHPLFIAPPYYPQPQPVSANWQVDDHMGITGSFYFALTPGALMAGGGLNAVWEASGLRAWFNESADFLLGWRPFRYAADLNLSLGVSYTLDLLFTSVTIGVSLGVSASLAGPPLHGDVHVDLYVVSFTISFGDDDDRSEQTPISWEDFKQTLLPSEIAPPSTAALTTRLARPLPHDALDAPAPPVIVTDTMCRARVTQGLAKDLSSPARGASTPSGTPPTPDWIFTGHDFEVATESVFASTGLSQGGHTVAPTWAQTVEAGPAGARQGAYSADHAVSFVDEQGVDQAAPGGLVTVTPTTQALPLANWNVDAALSPTADHLNQRVIDNGLVGTRLTPTPRTYDQLPTPVALTVLASEQEVPAQHAVAGSGFVAPAQTFPQTRAQFDTIGTPAAQAARNAIIRLALLDGSHVQTTGLLGPLGQDSYLTQEPRVVATGA